MIPIKYPLLEGVGIHSIVCRIYLENR